MKGRRTPLLAGVSALALLAGSGAAIAATHPGSHHAKPAIQYATNQGTATTPTTTTPAGPGAAPNGRQCPDSSSSTSSGSRSSTSPGSSSASF
ncbi:MAG TPA: hypothetical protein VH063_01055 [Gaiellaceae bacterium]|nr:hypothetical protein [Gaiellaceae bacterium]